MRVVQLFGREADVGRGEFAAAQPRAPARRTCARSRSTRVFFPVVEVLTAVALALLLWYGGLRTLGGTLTVGVLAAFIQLTRRFFQPLQDLSEKFNLLQSAMASSERVFAPARRAGRRCPSRTAPRPLPRPVRGEVRFEGVWFRYGPTAPWVLRDVSFTASPGRDGRAGGAHRGGEDHDRQPAAPVLRPGARPDHGRRRGHPRALDRGAARG